MSQQNVDRPKQTKGHRCVKIIKLIFAAFPSIIFGGFTIVFSLQQNQVATQNREQDQRQADTLNMRTTFENYIDQISTRLIDPTFSRNSTEHLLNIRVKTLHVLRHVDASMKGSIIYFLHEYGLLRSNIPENERLNLFGAYLHDVQFIGSSIAPIQLDYLYLPGIYASNIVFSWCHLKYAVFDDASMSNMKILNSTISNARFRHTYAPGATMGNVIFHQNDLTGAIFARTHFIGVTGWEYGLDLTNADLFGSYTGQGVPLRPNELPTNLIIFQNTRLADGSFVSINSSNLIVDGGAEKACRSNDSQRSWLPRFDAPLMQLSSTKSHPTHPDIKGNGSCYFLAPPSGTSSLIQSIHVHSFSVLIDSGHAAFNLSAYLGCVGQGSKWIFISIAYLLDNNIWRDRSQNLTMMEKPKIMSLQTGSIPEQTRVLRIEIMGEVQNGSSAMCVIDDIHLRIIEHRE